MIVIFFLWIFCTIRLFPSILFLFWKFIFIVLLFFSFCLICIYLYIHNLIVFLDASRWADWDSESEIWLHQIDGVKGQLQRLSAAPLWLNTLGWDSCLVFRFIEIYECIFASTQFSVYLSQCELWVCDIFYDVGNTRS